MINENEILENGLRYELKSYECPFYDFKNYENKTKELNKSLDNIDPDLAPYVACSVSVLSMALMKAECFVPSAKPPTSAPNPITPACPASVCNGFVRPYSSDVVYG
jgi:hypothetical protein